jgi:hypothetical protein
MRNYVSKRFGEFDRVLKFIAKKFAQGVEAGQSHTDAQLKTCPRFLESILSPIHMYTSLLDQVSSPQIAGMVLT